MKVIYTLLVVFFITASLNAQTKITLEDAGKYVGEKVTINGKITGSVYKNPTRQTQLSMGHTAASTALTIIINQADRRNFSYTPETFLVNRTVSLTGKIVDLNGVPVIIVTKPEEIRLDFEGGADVEFTPLGFDTFNKFFDED